MHYAYVNGILPIFDNIVNKIITAGLTLFPRHEEYITEVNSWRTSKTQLKSKELYHRDCGNFYSKLW